MSSRAASTRATRSAARRSSQCIEDGDESINDILSSRGSHLHMKIWHRNRNGVVKSAKHLTFKEEHQRRPESLEIDEKLRWECEQRKRLMHEIDKKRRSSAGSIRSSLSDTRKDNQARPFTAKPSVSRLSSRDSIEQSTIDKMSVNGVKINATDSEHSDRDRVIVTSHNAKLCPKIWRREALDRVKTASRVVTKEELQQQAEKFEAERRRLELECEQRKQLLKDIDKKKQSIAKRQQENGSGSKGSDDENGESATKAIDRAFLAKQEETEEIRKVNRLILATKCHVVRDAQITEKQEIHRHLRAEELQLEKKLLDDCDKAQKEEVVQREEQKKLNEKYADDLREQLKRRELKKYLESQRIEDEAKVIAQAKTAMEEDLRRQEQERKDKIAQLRRELQQANKLSDVLRNVAFEEQRIAEMKAQEHMRMRRQREVELEKERQLLREEKQRQADRMLVLQTRLQETKSEKDEIYLRLIREEKDRQFRQKEKEAAHKRKEMERKILTAREAQLEEMKRQKEFQAAQEKEEYEQFFDRFKKEEEKEQKEKKQLHQMKGVYRKEIIKQMEEKLIKSKESRSNMMQESNLEREKEELRKKTLETIIKNKINDMRHANIPENLIKDVERQISLSETVKFTSQI